MKTFSFVVTVAGILGIGFYFVLHQSKASARTTSAANLPDDPQATTNTTENDIASLNRQLGQVRAELTSVRAQLSVSSPTPDAPREATGSESGTGRRDPQAMVEQNRDWHERMAGVEKAFRSEVRDARWSSNIESVLRSAAADDENMRGTLNSVDCRSQTCRVEIIDDGSGKVGKALPSFIIKIAQALPQARTDTVDDGNGHRTMVMYMTRPGAPIMDH